MKNQALKVLAVFAPAAILVTEAVAYSGTSTANTSAASMDGLYAEILSWVNGPLGTILALAAVTVGLGMGIMQQSVAAAIVGIAFAAVVAYGPNILAGITGSAVESVA